jgi:Ribonuclease G/E
VSEQSKKRFKSAKEFAKHYFPKSYAPCPHCNGTGVKRMSEPRKWGRL